jgi:hypothetical protein
MLPFRRKKPRFRPGFFYLLNRSPIEGDARSFLLKSVM